MTCTDNQMIRQLAMLAAIMKFRTRFGYARKNYERMTREDITFQEVSIIIGQLFAMGLLQPLTKAQQRMKPLYCTLRVNEKGLQVLTKVRMITAGCSQ